MVVPTPYHNLVAYLIDKYGAVGTRKQPISIDEDIYLSGSNSDGLVTHLYIPSSLDEIYLYSADHSNTGYAVNLYNVDGAIIAANFLYD